MPEVKKRAPRKGPPKGKKPAPGAKAAVKQTRDATSVLLGLVFLSALIVAVAAWMGGSISVIEQRLALAVDGSAKTLGLSVARIDVVGTSPQHEEDIRLQLGFGVGSNMFRADPQELRSRLESMDQIAYAEVHRLWPDQVLIIVEPSEATALWQKNGKWQVVDAAGRVLKTEKVSESVNLPKVVGQGGAFAAPALFETLNAFPDVQKRTKAAIRVGNRRWDLVLVNDGLVSLPLDYVAGLERLSRLHQRTQILDRIAGRLDIRDPERLYLTPQPVQTADLLQSHGEES